MKDLEKHRLFKLQISEVLCEVQDEKIPKEKLSTIRVQVAHDTFEELITNHLTEQEFSKILKALLDVAKQDLRDKAAGLVYPAVDKYTLGTCLLAFAELAEQPETDES